MSTDAGRKRLDYHVGKICDRIARGQMAARNTSVMFQFVLRIASILLSSLGGAGVIVDKVGTNLPGQSGWTFWISVIVLGLGILSQLASEFQVAKLAADSWSLAEKCDVYDSRLERVLNSIDPRTEASVLLEEVNKLFEEPNYSKVLPRITDKIVAKASSRAFNLIASNEKNWNLPSRKQQGVAPPRTLPAAPTLPPTNPALDPNLAAPLPNNPAAPIAPESNPEPPGNTTGEKNP